MCHALRWSKTKQIRQRYTHLKKKVLWVSTIHETQINYNSNHNAFHGQLWNQFICGAKQTNSTQLLICWGYKVSKSPDCPRKRTDFQSYFQKRSTSIVRQCVWFSNAPHRKYSVQILQLRLMVPCVLFFPSRVAACYAQQPWKCDPA